MSFSQSFRRKLSVSCFSLGTLTLACLGAMYAPQAEAAGLLTPAGQSSSLAIEKHHVDVTVEDGYVITRVEQVFSNSQSQDLDAVYSFPVPEDATVSGFTVWIDGKPVLGEVLEKQQARQVHEEEKQRGRDTGLAEKNGYKTFDLSVSPVRANSNTRLRLTYMQPVAMDTGIGRFVYPLEEGGVDPAQQQFWQTDDRAKQFSFDMKIRSAAPVDAVRMAGRQANIQQTSPGQWRITMGQESNGTPAAQTDAGDGASQLRRSVEDGDVHAEAAAGQQGKKDFRLNKDLVVYWRLAPDQPASVDLMTFKPDANGRGTFMMVMTPGSDLKPIQRGKDWTFVIDMSGSMKGKFNTVMQGLDMAFNKFTPQDRVRVIGFNRQAWDVSNGFVHANPADLGQLIHRLKERGPNGGTNLYAGLQEAARIVDDDRTSSIVLVTDGVANVGKTARNEFLDLVNQHDLRLFTMIMGNSANRPLLTDLTDASGGFAISVSNADDVVGQLLRAVGKVSHEAMHNVQVSARGVRTADIVRSRDSSLYFGDQLMVFGHYWGDGDTTFQLDAEVSGQPRQWQTNVRLPGVSQENPEIERLWAYAMIRQLQRQQSRLGESADTKQAIIDIATQYSLVTDNTSMVVMTEQAFAERGIERRNQARTAVEQTAQRQRAAKPVTSRRVDQAQPTFQGNRPQVSGGNSSRSGGGHINLLFLLMLAVPLVAQRVRRGASSSKAA